MEYMEMKMMLYLGTQSTDENEQHSKIKAKRRCSDSADRIMWIKGDDVD